MFFGKSVGNKEAKEIINILKVGRIKLEDKYLGMPLFTHRSKNLCFNSTLENLKGRLPGWRGHHLTHAGKAVMIKHVSDSLATYQMTCFVIPKNITRKMDALNRALFWGHKEGQTRGWCPKNWSDVCISKSLGGLGFKKYSVFNLAMITKTVWRLIHNQDCLWGKIMKVKYFKNLSPLLLTKDKPPPNSSWLWKCL